ncbi:hypothetical protein TVAG_371860 [Trichomonas vaginalis G3]|uniref:Uncharacterized protein n=1 Tax=Trichomonas vaginalis (strain ATCC PRA-98 / G3) TaxID=412133 RepID=A2E0V7_TRIV3|nr:armadillo (ARM) repeat-containing protein family [Trichomonas vaginalis G3]EAY13712.1 hypothetical protein TVAG_371860 [Trichomonas vaginalis G3]KAI5529644.1 armadillo (ARM) repeat-containing protein family [Trichomonas vaginalis G3]|eukprot:XP_001325935.1 hypothetical protein [Trichomonas vaginalis G3]
MNYKKTDDNIDDIDIGQNKEKELKWIGPNILKINIESDEVSELSGLIKTYSESNEKNRLNNKIIECMNHIDLDISDLLQENDITPNLIDQTQHAKQFLRASSYNLLYLLAKNSVLTAHHIYDQFDYFKILIPATSNGIDILKLLTVFLTYCNDLTENVINNQILEFLYSEVITNSDYEELFDEGINFLLAFLQTKNAFPDQCYTQYETIFNILSEILVYLLTLNKEGIKKVKQYDILITYLLCTLVSHEDIGHFADVLQGMCLSNLYNRIQKIENLPEYFEFFHCLCEFNPEYAMDFVEDSPIISTLMRYFQISENKHQVLNFLIHFADISERASMILYNANLLDIFIQSGFYYKFDENAPTVLQEGQVFDLIDEPTKEKYIYLFTILCYQIPKLILQDDAVYRYIIYCIDMYELLPQDFEAKYFKAIQALFANGLIAEKIDDIDEFCDFLEDMSINSEDEVVSATARSILNFHFEKFE